MIDSCAPTASLGVCSVRVVNPIVFCASSMADSLNEIGTVSNESVFEPSVFKNCPVPPSEAGIGNPFTTTVPLPLPVNSMLSFDSLALTVLSVIIAPDDEMVLSPIVKAVNVPAPGVVPPITTLSTEPPFKSIEPN